MDVGKYIAVYIRQLEAIYVVGAMNGSTATSGHDQNDVTQEAAAQVCLGGKRLSPDPSLLAFQVVCHAMLWRSSCDQNRG